MVILFSGAFAVLAALSVAPPSLSIHYPLPEAVFPSDMAAPTIRWVDSSESTRWRVAISAENASRPVVEEVQEMEWRPSLDQWALIREECGENKLRISVEGYLGDRKRSAASVTVRISEDPVGAPIFYRDVPLPVKKALQNLENIRWRLGRVSDRGRPPAVLKDMSICANCHSASRDGRVFGMDVDYRGDKGAFAIANIGKEVRLSPEGIVSWSSVGPDLGSQTFGLFARISPDGRFIAATVNDKSVFEILPELGYSQLFFPIRGQVAFHDRQEGTFSLLKGADDPSYLQSNPVFSPDGKTVVFIRAARMDRSMKVADFIERKAFFTYDLYRVPFNGGKGGIPEPIHGASANGWSNYFPAFSPDGKWIVFTRSKGFMINQPDAELWIIKVEGGTPRRMRCNFRGKMNSWHSFSPNGKWMVFAAKDDGPYTRLWITHIDEDGFDSPPVFLEEFTAPDRAANLPEFFDLRDGEFKRIVNELTQ